MGIIDGKTSTTSWNSGAQSITFVTNKLATANICVAAPVAAPMAAPRAPVAGAPITPPVSGGDTSMIPFIIGSVLFIVGVSVVAVFVIW